MNNGNNPILGFSTMPRMQQEEVAAAQGMSVEDLQALLAENEGLAGDLNMAFGASLMKPLDYQGEGVGPYNVHVNNAARRGLSGLSQGLNAGMQMRGNRALLDALRNKGGGEGAPVMRGQGLPDAPGASRSDFAGSIESPMVQPMPDNIGGSGPMGAYEDVSPGAGLTDPVASAQGAPMTTTAPATPPAQSPTLANPPAGAAPITPPMGTRANPMGGQAPAAPGQKPPGMSWPEWQAQQMRRTMG